MKYLGQFLLWIGFLSGALATVSHAPRQAVVDVKQLTPGKIQGYDLPDLSGVPLPDDNWNLIPWLWYGISVAVCIGGIVAIRANKRVQQQEAEADHASLPEITTALSDAIRETSKLRDQVETLPPSQIVAFIDREISEPLRRFADGRNAITARYDLHTFADVMTQFAAGERSVNRAWSASADGYLDETATCLERAQAMLEKAMSILNDREAGVKP